MGSKRTAVSCWRWCAFSILLLAVFGLVPLSRATTFAPKTDNEIVALELRSGKLLWSHKPPTLSFAHFEIYPQGLIAYPNYSGDDRSNPIFLNPQTGEQVPPFERPRNHLLAKSATFWPPHTPDMVLENGWALTGFLPRNSKSIRFAEPTDGHPEKIVWEIETGVTPYNVRAWNNMVFYTLGNTTGSRLFTYRAGETKPVWAIDLHQTVEKYVRSVIFFQVIDGVIYLAANEHIFAFDAQRGTLQWHRDLAAELGLRGLKFPGEELVPKSDFFGGGLTLGVFAKDQGVLIVSFERRVVALDLKTNEYLWHLDPDTFPGCLFPVIHDSKVFLTSGANRKLTKIQAH